MHKKTAFFIFSVFFAYLFLIFQTHFSGPDEPIYYAYTASIIEDGDLNAVNYVNEHYPYLLEDNKIGISKTYNLPDFHNHGGVILWAPFYLYAKIFFNCLNRFNLEFLRQYDLESFTKFSLSFSTLIFGFITCFLTYLVCRIFTTFKTAYLSVFMIFLGIPFFYFTLVEIGNANIIAALFAALLIIFGYYMRKSSIISWFFYGLFFSICIVVKIDLWFYAFFIGPLFISSVLLKRAKWHYAFYLLLGFISGFLLKTVNDYLKYGFFTIAELKIVNLKDSYLLEQLFSTYRGFFYTSPVFYICVLGCIIIAVRFSKYRTFSEDVKFKILFPISLILTIAAKILIMGNRYSWGGGTPGARLLLSEFTIIAVLYAFVLDWWKNSFWKAIFLIISLACIIWNFLIISEFIAGVDLYRAMNFVPLISRFKTMSYLLNHLMIPKDFLMKIIFIAPLLVIALIIYALNSLTIRSKFNINLFAENIKFKNRFFYIFTACLFIAYSVVTGFNIINNKKNVLKLTNKGFFENSVLLLPQEYEKMENMGSMDEMIQYFKLKGDLGRVNKIEKYKKETYGQK